MKNITIIFFLLATFTITGCATEAKYLKTLDSWVGDRFVRLTNRWGYPSETRILPDGNKEHAYIKETKFYLGNVTTVTPAGANGVGYKNVKSLGEPERRWCRTYFEVDRNDIILNWRCEGNSCN